MMESSFKCHFKLQVECGVRMGSEHGSLRFYVYGQRKHASSYSCPYRGTAPSSAATANKELFPRFERRRKDSVWNAISTTDFFLYRWAAAEGAGVRWLW